MHVSRMWVIFDGGIEVDILDLVFSSILAPEVATLD